MKKVSFEQFNHRIQEVAKARAIFIPNITKNISVAFQLYLDVLAEEQLGAFVTSAAYGSKPMSPLDDYERPKCQECGEDLLLKIGSKDESDKAWETSWYCEKCFSEYYSTKTVQEWMNELVKVR